MTPKLKMRKLRFIFISLLTLILVTVAIIKIQEFTNRDPLQEMEDSAIHELYSQAAELPKKWNNRVDYIYAITSPEAVREKVAFTKGTYATQILSSNTVQWDALFYSKRISGGGLWYKQVGLMACIRYLTELTKKDISVAPIPCPAEQKLKGLGDEVVLTASELNRQVGE